eukprot:6224718-Amphidinium_carterae.1
MSLVFLVAPQLRMLRIATTRCINDAGAHRTWDVFKHHNTHLTSSTRSYKRTSATRCKRSRSTCKCLTIASILMSAPHYNGALRSRSEHLQLASIAFQVWRSRGLKAVLVCSND